MYDIMEEGVTCNFFVRSQTLIVYCVVVENIKLGRQPLPGMEAIYFLTPGRILISKGYQCIHAVQVEESIDALIQDFKDAKDPQYQCVHLFLTTGKE